MATHAHATATLPTEDVTSAPVFDPAQLDAFAPPPVPGSRVKVNGKWVPATQANVARAAGLR